LVIPTFPLAVLGTAYLMNRFFAIDLGIVRWVYSHTMPILEKKEFIEGEPEKGSFTKNIPVLLFLAAAFLSMIGNAPATVSITLMYVALSVATVELGIYYGGKEVGPAVMEGAMELLPWKPNYTLEIFHWVGLGSIIFSILALLAGWFTWPLMLAGLILGVANYATFRIYNAPEPAANGRI